MKIITLFFRYNSQKVFILCRQINIPTNKTKLDQCWRKILDSLWEKSNVNQEDNFGLNKSKAWLTKTITVTQTWNLVHKISHHNPWLWIDNRPLNLFKQWLRLKTHTRNDGKTIRRIIYIFLLLIIWPRYHFDLIRKFSNWFRI